MLGFVARTSTAEQLGRLGLEVAVAREPVLLRGVVRARGREQLGGDGTACGVHRAQSSRTISRLAFALCVSLLATLPSANRCQARVAMRADGDQVGAVLAGDVDQCLRRIALTRMRLDGEARLLEAALVARQHVHRHPAHVDRVALAGQPEALERRAAGIGADEVDRGATAAREVDHPPDCRRRSRTTHRYPRRSRSWGPSLRSRRILASFSLARSLPVRPPRTPLPDRTLWRERRWWYSHRCIATGTVMYRHGR